MNIQTLASAVLQRLLVSLAIFVLVFVCICVLYHVPPSDWILAMLASMPWAVSVLFVLVSAIWFIAQHVRNWQR
jgi:hypothetical protein